jgi:diguanylate cyclase (GGDEF)-like protein
MHPGRLRGLRRLAATALWSLAGLLALAPSAQAERWQGWKTDLFRHIGTAEGLPNGVSTAVTQDSQGYIWVGTMGGVARWDGYHALAYTHDPARPGLLPDSIVQTLFRDSRGRVWVGTNSAGLVAMPGPHGPAQHIGVGPQGLQHGSVRAIVDDGAGGLWVGTDAGLDHVDPRTGTVTRVGTGGKEGIGLVGGGAVSLLRDRRGRLWVGTGAGLFVRAPGQTDFSAVPLPLRPAQADGGEDDAGRTPRPDVLLEDSAGRLWVGTNSHGVFVRDSDQAPWRAVMETQAVNPGRSLRSYRVLSMLEARPGEVWAGTLGQGIVAIDARTGRTRRLNHQALQPESLPDNQVRGMYRDDAGLVWVATYGGLARIDPRAEAVLNITPGGPEDQADRSSVGYASILAHSDGRIWVGTQVHGVEVLDPDSGQRLTLRPDGRAPAEALPPDPAVSLVEGLGGSVFIGTFRGLYRAHAPTGSRPRVERIAWPGRPPAQGVGPLLRDSGRLWIGGLTDGLWQMDLASGQVRHVLSRPAEALSDHRISALALGRDGAVWIGTRNGLNRLDPASGQVQKIPAGGTGPGQLSGGFIAAMLVDRDGRLWVASYGGGLYRLERGGDGRLPATFSRVTAAEGLPDNNVNAVLQDDTGRIWVSTDSGLAVVDPQTLKARPMRRAEGVTHKIYWTDSAARTARGELLFGATGGFSVVRPTLLQTWQHRPAVVVTSLRVNGRPAEMPASGAALSLGPQPHQLEVEYAALDHSAPERNRYAHRLQGLDDDWLPTAATRRLATYSNLPPGQYRLLMRGSNRDGVFSEQPATLALHVVPAWHQTLWFRLLAGLALLGVVYALVHARTRVLQTRRVQLQRLVDERTLELQALSHALSEKSRALEEKSRVLERASISDPLTGLHNRRFLTEHIESALAASLRRAQAHAGEGRTAPDTDTLFFLIDVDHFKDVNDEHGHAAGDAVLVQLAERLRLLMRESDELVRWGGEEFLAVARDTDRARADELAERIRAGVAEAPFHLPEGRKLALSCSIGHACWPFIAEHPQALDWSGVVNVADMGLLAAKRLGRNAWVGLQASADTPYTTLAALVRAMPQQAVQQGRLRLSSSHDTAAAAQALSGR